MATAEPSIGPPPEQNPKYWELIQDSGPLADQWGDLNLRITLFSVPKVPLRGTKQRLYKLSNEFEQLQADTNRWLKRAENFFFKHPPRFATGQNLVLNVLWAQDQIDKRINSMQTLKLVTHYSIRHHGDKIDQQQNFAIAICSLVLAVIGIALSTVGIVLALRTL